MEEVSWEIDSVLLELQMAMFDNFVPIAFDQRSPEFRRQQLISKVQRFKADVADARRANKPLVVQIYENDSPRRIKIASRNTCKVIAFVLEKVHHLLLSNMTALRRDIYYQNVRLFRSQSTVDSAVDRICQILDTPQWNLGIQSTSKGLVYGPLIIQLKSGESIDCSQQPGGTLIPQALPYGTTYETDAQFALIIEKDTAFQSLLSSGLRGPLGSCLLITGKGYPDLNTRVLVKDLTVKLSLPTFAIVDGDPHGIDIFFNYKYGSKAKRYINRYLAAPDVLWLGIHPRDFIDLVPPGIERLTFSDLRKAQQLLTRTYVQSNEQMKAQIEQLIAQGMKCEIENVSSISNHYLSDVYIPYKISLKRFI